MYVCICVCAYVCMYVCSYDWLIQYQQIGEVINQSNESPKSPNDMNTHGQVLESGKD